MRSDENVELKVLRSIFSAVEENRGQDIQPESPENRRSKSFLYRTVQGDLRTFNIKSWRTVVQDMTRYGTDLQQAKSKIWM